MVYSAGNKSDRCGKAGEVNSCSQPTCFLGRPSLWISRVHLLELGAGRVVRKERSVGAPRDGGIRAGKALGGFLGIGSGRTEGVHLLPWKSWSVPYLP